MLMQMLPHNDAWQAVLNIKDENAAHDKLLFAQLCDSINDLIVHDFDRLLGLLYRHDVSEQKIKTLLKENPDTNASENIARLVIERQVQKIKSRQEHRRDQDNISEEERW